MKKLILLTIIFAFLIQVNSQAQNSLGIGFRSGPWVGASPTGLTTTDAGDGQLVLVCNNLGQYDALNYTLNDGASGNKVNIDLSAGGYVTVWAKSTTPVSLRIDLASNTDPGCLCSNDRAANQSAKTSSQLTTTMQPYALSKQTDWNQAYTSDNGPVDATKISHINIYAVPVSGSTYTGTITIDSIRISDAAITLGLDHSAFVNNSSKLFPIPAKDKVALNYTLNEGADVKILVNNLIGMEQMTLLDARESSGLHTHSFDIASLTYGIYHVSIMVNGKIVKSEKLLVE